ncbi:hypothetical protein EDL81_01970 [Ehrlichia ruminantium]|uniref:hypothetical protein n=1 Tax=Ehrlichia ruminantium TaxID=779 RepID=UPI00130D809A|nr:hypothetical protein [Ehrlichia ruminantium]QGR02433.1 hypothetical protein EDL81_01970 [Ehrlichia ruminantium]
MGRCATISLLLMCTILFFSVLIAFIAQPSCRIQQPAYVAYIAALSILSLISLVLLVHLIMLSKGYSVKSNVRSIRPDEVSLYVPMSYNNMLYLTQNGYYNVSNVVCHPIKRTLDLVQIRGLCPDLTYHVKLGGDMHSEIAYGDQRYGFGCNNGIIFCTTADADKVSKEIKKAMDPVLQLPCIKNDGSISVTYRGVKLFDHRSDRLIKSSDNREFLTRNFDVYLRCNVTVSKNGVCVGMTIYDLVAEELLTKACIKAFKSGDWNTSEHARTAYAFFSMFCPGNYKRKRSSTKYSLLEEYMMGYIREHGKYESEYYANQAYKMIARTCINHLTDYSSYNKVYKNNYIDYAGNRVDFILHARIRDDTTFATVCAIASYDDHSTPSIRTNNFIRSLFDGTINERVLSTVDKWISQGNIGRSCRNVLSMYHYFSNKYDPCVSCACKELLGVVHHCSVETLIAVARAYVEKYVRKFVILDFGEYRTIDLGCLSKLCFRIDDRSKEGNEVDYMEEQVVTEQLDSLKLNDMTTGLGHATT